MAYEISEILDILSDKIPENKKVSIDDLEEILMEEEELGMEEEGDLEELPEEGMEGEEELDLDMLLEEGEGMEEEEDEEILPPRKKKPAII